jgi:hypothetical protein
MGCQYIDPHNLPILNVFNFNTNIQIGDVSQVFYSTLYTSKLTQEEDSEKQLWIRCAVIKRIKRLLEENSSRESSNDGCNQDMLESSFVRGYVEFYLDLMQQQQEMSSVQQWHTSYHQMEVHALFSHMTFLIYW